MRATLQTKILALVLLGVGLPVTLMGGYLLRRNEEALGEKVRETMSNQLFRTTSRLADWIQQRLHEATRWSASFVVFEGVEALASGRGDTAEARREVTNYLTSVLGHHRDYESLFILDLEGRILASTREEKWEEWEKGVLARGVSARGVSVSPLHRSEFLGRPTMLVLHTIQDRSDRTIGYFIERLDVRELESLLRGEDTTAASFSLLDAQGRILVQAGRLPPNPGTEVFGAPLPDADAAAGPVREDRLSGFGNVVYALRRLDGPLRGYVAATVPASVAYQPLYEDRNRLLALGSAALGVVLLASFLVARSLLRPILLLSGAAKRVSAGDLDVSLPVRGHDEIADLTRAFNDMALGIRDGRQRLEEANRRLEGLATTDGLTGLFNRRHFEETLEKEIRRAEREGRLVSLLLLDLDNFKQYNDRWGHIEGDAELRRVAVEVMQTVRSTDLAFRYGGEELAVLLHSCNKEQAVGVAEKIRQAVCGPDGAATQGRTTTVSIGVATFPLDGAVARALVDAADTALYQAKDHGRNRVVMASGTDDRVPFVHPPAPEHAAASLLKEPTTIDGRPVRPS